MDARWQNRAKNKEIHKNNSIGHKFVSRSREEHGEKGKLHYKSQKLPVETMI